METLNLRVRYFQDSTPADVPCRETAFIRREFDMPLAISETALVLVDVWNVHFIESWIERAARITTDCIVPVLDAARRVGLTIVHAPSPPVAEQYPQLQRHKPPEPSAPSTWPPSAFRSREGDYAVYRGPRSQPPGIGVHWDELAPQLAVSPAIDVKPEEFVVATGQQLHELLEERRILHLLYAGFATNWCVLGRDYGIRSMKRYGYNIVLLRDATTGVEFPDTYDDLLTTEISIREVEQQYGFSVSNADFLAAIEAAHLPMEALTAGLANIRQSPKAKGVLELIVRRPQTETREVLDEGELDPAEGLVGDNWKQRGSSQTADGSAHPDMQLTLTSVRLMALVAPERQRWPLAGDQLYVDLDLSVDNVPPGTRLSVGEAVIQITEPPHTGCKKYAARFGLEVLRFISSPEGKRLQLRGVNARVIRPGAIRVGDVVRKLSN